MAAKRQSVAQEQPRIKYRDDDLARYRFD